MNKQGRSKEGEVEGGRSSCVCSWEQPISVLLTVRGIMAGCNEYECVLQMLGSAMI